MLFAEVFSGSSQAWFADGWGLLLTFPLYLSHVLFFLWLAFKLKRTSLSQLYLFGALFGLYEAWITKVLWAGYMGQAGFMAGSVAGIGISEFPVLVFFWHPIMSFIVPVLAFEALTGRALKEHVNILRKSAKKTELMAIFLVLMSAFVATGSGYDLILANLSLAGTLLIIFGLYHLAKKSHLRFFELSKIIAAGLVIYLLLLYGAAFFLLLPERIPQTLIPYASIIVFYFLVALIIHRSKKAENELVQLDEGSYSINDFKKFGLISVLAVNIAVLVPDISIVVMIIAYFALAFVGVMLFASAAYKTIKS